MTVLHQISTSPGRCAGCSTPIPPSRGGPARKWCSEKCRKRSYDLVCVDCGGRVGGTTPGKMVDPTAPVCGACTGAHYRTWTREAILLSIQEWADAQGGIPPTAPAWVRGTKAHPSSSYVVDVFGAWNAAITAAGLEARPPGHYGRAGEDLVEVRRTIDLYRSGLSAAEIGLQLGIGPNGVLYRLKVAGEPRRSARSTWSTREQRVAESRRLNEAREARHAA